MKRILPFVLTVVGLSAHSQEISDALRLAQDNISGTARFNAMGGAFGALGGDLSSISINPAGSAIFNNHQVGGTLTSYNVRNTVGYFGTNNKQNDNSFDLSQAGGVYVLKNEDEKSGWKKLTLAIDYESTNNFENSWYASGVNPNNSIANYFLAYANAGAVPLGLLQNSFYEELSYADAQAFLGYQGYVINPADENTNNTQYGSNIPAGGNYSQENAFVSSGFNGKVSFNVAAQYKDKLYIGLNLNSHFADYRQSTAFYEENSNDPANGLQQVRFDNDLYTYGTGFSFQVGAIAKLTKDFRVGLAYQSPTWFRLNDEISQALASVSINPDTNQEMTTIVDPNVIMIYDTYKLYIPGKWTGSMAYVFDKYGLISIDCSLKDYSNTEYSPENEFIPANNDMSNQLDANVFDVRIGAEHRIKQFSIRGGYHWEESPYKNNETVGDLTGFSGGVGYNFGEYKIDLSYSHSRRVTKQGFFGPAFGDYPTISSVNNNISVSLIYEL
jgi:long-subunit fatty acid transport protein